MRKGLIVLLIIAGLFLAGAGFWYNNTQKFLANASQADGVVVALVPVKGDKSTTYAPRISFKTANGQEVTFKSSVSSNPPSYSTGESVVILYNPTSPQASATINSFTGLWLGPTIIGGIGAVLFLIAVLSLVFSIRKSKRSNWLKTHGTLVQSQFVSAGPSNISVNNKSAYVITSQWQHPHSGLLYIFTSDYIWFDPEPFIKKEQEISVYVDLGNPKKYAVDLSFLPKQAN